MAGMPCKKKKKKKKKKEEEEEEKGKADLTTVLHIRELPHLHMKLAVWFSFPTTNNKNPMIPSSKINRKKTELMKMNTTANAPITVGGEPIREVESFVYIGSVVDHQGGTDRDVTARIGKARAAFVMLKNIWASGGISMRTKHRIFKRGRGREAGLATVGGETLKQS